MIIEKAPDGTPTLTDNPDQVVSFPSLMLDSEPWLSIHTAGGIDYVVLALANARLEYAVTEETASLTTGTLHKWITYVMQGEERTEVQLFPAVCTVVDAE